MVTQAATKQMRLHRLAFGEHFAGHLHWLTCYFYNVSSVCCKMTDKVFMKYAG
jgi:hypothetical protein